MKSILKNGSVLTLGLAFFVGATVSAAPNSQLKQKINPGVLSVDIIDTTNSDTPVASPSVDFTAQTFSFADQTSPGIFGTAAETVRVSNATGVQAWSLSIAASNVADEWTNGTDTYDFNAAGGGQLTIDAATNGVVAGFGGTCTATGVSLGSSAAFVQGSTDSVDLLTAVGADKHCQWDMTAVDFSQNIPGSTPDGDYTLDMVLTAA